MICDLIFKLEEGKESTLTIETESPTYPTSDEILNALKNPLNAKERDDLFQYIEDNYDIRSTKSLDLDQILTNPEGLVGNTTVSELASKNPDVKFPEGVNAQVLAVKSLISGGRTISGRCITSNGEELFIINNSDDIIKLAKFLTTRKVLQENPNLYDENSDNYADLEILRTKYNKASIAELILDFIEYKDSLRKSPDQKQKISFRQEYFINSKGEVDFAYNFLDKISRQVEKYEQVVQYSNPFVNAISKLHRLRKENAKDKEPTLKAISYEELYYAVKAFYPDLLKTLEATTPKKFAEKMRSYDFDGKELGYTDQEIVENKPLVFTFLNKLIKDEPRYQYEIHSTTTDEVRLKWKWNTLESQFGIGYETIKTFDIVNKDYKGYKIYAFNYNGKKIFTYSRNYLTEDTTVYETFDTKKAAEEYISKKVLSEKLKTNSFVRFKYREVIDGVQDPSKYIYQIDNSSQVFLVGSIVESLDIPIDPRTQIIANEKYLLDSADSTLQDFYNIVDTWEIDDSVKNYIKSKIDNAEKAVAYIYRINQALKMNRSNDAVLHDIADYIAKAPKIAYYIHSRNEKQYNLIPTKPNDIKKWKEDKQYPVVQLLQAIQTVLQGKFGVPINLLTASQIAEKFPATGKVHIDPNIAKAFIYDGEIYVNTTIASGDDLLHEYTHIILGVLKSNPQSRVHYESMINNVWNESTQKERDQVLKDYSTDDDPNFQMDIREELFARKFSEYLLRKRTDDLKNIFQAQEVYMQEGIKTIFDLMGDEPLAKTYTRSINNVFRRFSSDVALLLKQGNGLDLEEIKNTRKKTAYITKQIKEGKITEIC